MEALVDIRGRQQELRSTSGTASAHCARCALVRCVWSRTRRRGERGEARAVRGMTGFGARWWDHSRPGARSVRERGVE